MVVFLASPARAPDVEKRDAAEPGPGATCFGGAGFAKATWLGGCCLGALYMTAV